MIFLDSFLRDSKLLTQVISLSVPYQTVLLLAFCTSTLVFNLLLMFFPALSVMGDNTTLLIQILQEMLELPVEELFPFTEEVVNCLHLVLSPDVPRRVVDLVKRVWFKIHTLMPRR